MSFFQKLKQLFTKSNSDSSYVPSLGNKTTNSQEYSAPTVTPPINTQSQNQESGESKFEEYVDKTKTFVSSTADEVKEQGAFLVDQIKEGIKQLDENTKEVREKVQEKIKETVDKVDNKINEFIEDEKRKEVEESKLDADKDGIADKPVEFGKSVSEKHDQFFNKAEQWLKNAEEKEKSNATKSSTTDNRLELPKE